MTSGSCYGYSGYGCSNDYNAYTSSSAGTCVKYAGCQTSGHVRMNCGTTCTVGSDDTYDSCDSTSGDACDNDPGGSFSQNGLCANNEGSNVCVSSGFVTYTGSSYMSGGSFSGVADFMACDRSVSSGGDFSQNGIICNNDCVGTASSTCCDDSDCDSGQLCSLDNYPDAYICKLACYLDDDYDGEGLAGNIYLTTDSVCPGGYGNRVTNNLDPDDDDPCITSTTNCCDASDCSSGQACDVPSGDDAGTCKNVCYVDWDDDGFGSAVVNPTVDCSSDQLCDDSGSAVVDGPTGMLVAFDSSFDGDIFDNDAFLLFLFLSLFH